MNQSRAATQRDQGRLGMHAVSPAAQTCSVRSRLAQNASIAAAASLAAMAPLLRRRG